MSGYNGSGVFSYTFSWANDAANGIPITASRMDTQFGDSTSGFNLVICRDGQSTTTAAIPFAQGASFGGVSSFTSAGCLGLGMTPTNILDITQTVNDADARIQVVNAGTGQASTQLRLNNATHQFGLVMHGTGFSTSGPDRQDGARLYTDGVGGMSFDIPSDAFRWYVGGTNLYSFGASSATITPSCLFANGLSVTGSGGTINIDGNLISGDASFGVAVQVGGSGGVQLTNGASAWAAYSDYRLKNVAGDFSDSGKIIDAVPVHLAAMKTQPENTKAMFLAHELQSAVPYAVHGEKDGEEMQKIESTDPLVPIMWAEIRELRARLAAAGL